jgi:NAD(P)H-dependent FMN reductase
MNDQLNITVLIGTNRKLRESLLPARWLLGEMEKRPDIKTRLFDVADFALPHDDYGQEIKEQFPEWKEAILETDGLVIVTPEYNHGYPGTLKAVLDLLLREYIHRAVGFVSCSAQVWGGVRVIETLLPVVRELGLAATFTDLNFSRVHKSFDEQGKPLDTAFEKRASDFLDELVWMSRVLRWGRQSVPSIYHPNQSAQP